MSTWESVFFMGMCMVIAGASTLLGGANHTLRLEIEGALIVACTLGYVLRWLRSFRT